MATPSANRYPPNKQRQLEYRPSPHDQWERPVGTNTHPHRHQHMPSDPTPFIPHTHNSHKINTQTMRRGLSILALASTSKLAFVVLLALVHGAVGAYNCTYVDTTLPTDAATVATAANGINLVIGGDIGRSLATSTDGGSMGKRPAGCGWGSVVGVGWCVV